MSCYYPKKKYKQLLYILMSYIKKILFWSAEEISKATTAVRWNPKWKTEDFLIANNEKVNKYVMATYPKLCEDWKYDERQKAMREISFNCMLKIYQVYIATLEVQISD